MKDKILIRIVRDSCSEELYDYVYENKMYYDILPSLTDNVNHPNLLLTEEQCSFVMLVFQCKLIHESNT